MTIASLRQMAALTVISSVRARHAKRSVWGDLAEREKALPLA